MRVAYFSPLPPLRSGIADYSEELLPHLSRGAEIDLFVADGYEPAQRISERYPVHSHRRFADLSRTQDYDAVVYHVGNNSEYHEYVYRTLLLHPGVVVLHEFVLHHLIQGVTLAHRDAEGYAAELRYCYGQAGDDLARAMLETGQGADPFTYPMFEHVVDASLGTIVHSQHARQEVLRRRPNAKVAVVRSPFSSEAVTDAGLDRGASRAALGLPPEALVVASFGLITPVKRIEPTLRAFFRLRRELPGAMYILVGEIESGYDLRPVLDGGLGDGVVVTGRVDMETFLQYMSVTDLAVNLRYPTAGETSATLIRLLGMGKPVIVSNVGSFGEFPEDCCARVDVDDLEEDMLLSTMRALAVDQSLRQQMGANAQRYVQTYHTPEQTAQGYLDFIRDVMADPQCPVTHVSQPQVQAVDAVKGGLIADLASELADLGIQERDEAVLRDIATALVELNIDP